MKDYQVRRMFESIAFSYDFQNSFLSLRRDIYWRRVLAQSFRLPPGGLVLDVATGTAEVAIEVCRQHPEARVVGVDFSPRMLAVGRKKLISRGLADRVDLCLADSRWLPLAEATVDAVTIAFGIRNIEQRRLALAEFNLVLREGGELAIMEFDMPDDPVLGRLYRLYFNYILPPLGNWLSRNSYAYSYLATSVHGFPAERAFLQEIAAAGFHRLRVRKLTYGIAKIFSGTKKRGPISESTRLLS